MTDAPPTSVALLGTWKMVSWQREIVATGERLDALGRDPIGYISYGDDGRVLLLIVGRDRPAPQAAVPSEREKVGLFDSMMAYAGTYTVDAEKIVHHIDTSWNEAWTGTDQVRFYKIDGDTLAIRGAPARDPQTGQEVIYHVVFQRLPRLG
ncbi:MAG: lipocalin-like domain-containing protein [Xanthobacteraceae bacterium]